MRWEGLTRSVAGGNGSRQADRRAGGQAANSRAWPAGAGLARPPELFVRTLTEKLLTFGLGRGVEHYDAPAVRKIVRDARTDNYRFSRLIVGIVNSTPFQMRKSR
jgi:hypothetical protein